MDRFLVAFIGVLAACAPATSAHARGRDVVVLALSDAPIDGHGAYDLAWCTGTCAGVRREGESVFACARVDLRGELAARVDEKRLVDCNLVVR